MFSSWHQLEERRIWVMCVWISCSIWQCIWWYNFGRWRYYRWSDGMIDCMGIIWSCIWSNISSWKDSTAGESKDGKEGNHLKIYKYYCLIDDKRLSINKSMDNSYRQLIHFELFKNFWAMKQLSFGFNLISIDCLLIVFIPNFCPPMHTHYEIY